MDKNLLQKAKAPMIALINPQAPKGRPDVKHGCNPWAEATPANHRCNPCAVTHRAKTLLLLLLLAMTTAAQAQSIFGGGSGTETNPYIISTTDHLDQLAANVNSGMEYQNVYFKLMADLDYTGKTYTPIGNSYWEGGSESYHKFKGIFNGNNHSINNVTIYSEGLYCGLFGYVGWGGKIHNLTLGGQSTITAVGFAGGIAGVIDNAEIIGCNVGENVVITVHPIANNYSTKPGDFGGIVGESGGKVKDCISRATVSNGGIGKTKNIGGIAGSLYDNLMEDCFFLGVVDATGSTNCVGDILGKLSGSGQLDFNYYHTSNRHGGVDGNDTDNAKWMGTISCVSPVSGYGTSAVFDDGTTLYFGANRFTWVVLNYNVAEGYLPYGITYMANDIIPLTNPSGNEYPLTMPDDDVVITGTVEAIKRDIGYSDWVSITIPEQDYTGEPLTPVVTVVDNKDGAALTLEEGTHYTVTLPDGGCVIPGYHNITITGMGDFAGQTTKTFTILNPGNGTEEDPYIIRNTDQMDGLAASVNGGDSKSGKFFRLEADLDYTGKTYTRIGIDGNRPFSGTFDGNGHTISHVTLNENKNYMGLFGYSNGTVKNLTLDHSSIHAEGFGLVGGIVGCCDGGTVTGCYVTENVSISATGIDMGMGMGMLSGGDNVGGIVSYAYYCTVNNCMNFAEVSGVKYVGGVVGHNDNSIVTNNYYAGNCTVGGIGVSGSNSGSDVEGQAQRGYAIEPQQPLGISLEGSIGVLYEGKVYAGANQEVLVGLEVNGSSYVPQCLSFSAGTYTDNDDDTYTITMPAEDITVSGNIVEIDGMYYEISCNGGTTATVIYDISYDTLDYVGIEDFEYGGIQYTVTAIADGAFDGLDNLMGIYCHSNISTIGDYAFRNCTGIDYFGFYRTHTPPTLGEGVFEGLRIDTLSITVPFCSQYDYDQHAVFGQFGEIFGNEACEYNFYNEADDNQWSNPANWRNADYETCTEVPGADARVAIFADCEIGADVTVGSITIGGYYDEEFGYYEHLSVKNGATLTATSFIYNSGDARNFIIEDGAQVIHPNAGAQATVEKNITAYTPNSKNGWHLVSSPAIESCAHGGQRLPRQRIRPVLLPRADTLLAKPQGWHQQCRPRLWHRAAERLPLRQQRQRHPQPEGNAAHGHRNGECAFELHRRHRFGRLQPCGQPLCAQRDELHGQQCGHGSLPHERRSIGTANPLLPGEGFFVKATGDDASITFNSRAANAERSLSLSKGRINVELSENGLIVDRFILKRDGAPLEKFTLDENSTRIFATEGAQDWAVAVIASEAKQSSRTEQPINFKAAKNGTYTLTVNVENMDLDYLHLIDNLTGADVDLLTPPAFGHPLSEGEAQSGAELGSNSPATDSRTPAGVPPLQRGQGGFNYTFTAKTTDYASRFRLVFSAGDAGEDACEPPFAYINNGNIVITADAGDATLQIVDMMGRVIASYGGHTRYVTTNGMLAGVYVLRLINGDKVRVQKIVIE